MKGDSCATVLMRRNIVSAEATTLFLDFCSCIALLRLVDSYSDMVSGGSSSKARTAIRFGRSAKIDFCYAFHNLEFLKIRGISTTAFYRSNETDLPHG